MAKTHELHTKFWLSKRNFLTRCGLHEIHAMSQKLIPRDFFYVCNVFEGWGKENDPDNRPIALCFPGYGNLSL